MDPKDRTQQNQDDRANAQSQSSIGVENEKPKMTELEEYKKAVETLAELEINHEFSNSSPDHAAIVMTTIIKHAVKEVCIFDCNLDGTIAERTPEFYKTFERALKNGKKIKIVVYEDGNKETPAYKKFQQYSIEYKDNLSIREASPQFKEEIKQYFYDIKNFAVGDYKSYRVETSSISSSSRQARCNFNDKENASYYREVFDVNFNSCRKLF